MIKSKTKKNNYGITLFKTKKSEAGFTLMELIFTIAISAILLLSVIGIYIFTQKTYYSTDNNAEIVQNGRVILDRMIRELRQTPDIVTELPDDTSVPESLPDEIIFQDGHNTIETKYIRYYLSGEDIYRQIIVYYFDTNPAFYLFWHETNQGGEPPRISILENKLVGEYVQDIEFWGSPLININLSLVKNDQRKIIYTAVYGRSL
jgi:prepilin-type N-terminal cleavage/methylation domain-containing protein